MRKHTRPEACFQSNLAAGFAALEEIPVGRIVIKKPKGVIMKTGVLLHARQFGQVLTPLKEHSARLPPAFDLFYARIGQLDKKLRLPPAHFQCKCGAT